MREFKASDRVIVTSELINSDTMHHQLKIGSVGTVRAIRKNATHVLVDWDELMVGHDGDGRCRDRHGWWVQPSMIKVLDTARGEDNDACSMPAALRAQHPYGHPAFIQIVLDQLKLHSDKNHDYARGGDPLGNFKRVASVLSQYWPQVFGGEYGPAIVAFMYALKQVDAEGWSMKQGGECKVEGLTERLQDQAIYANIRLCMEKDRTKPKTPEPLTKETKLS